MNPDSFLVLDIIIILVALILLVWALNRDQHEDFRSSSDIAQPALQQRPAQNQEIAQGLQTNADAVLTMDELQAASTSEQIEDMVKKRLKSYADLVEVHLDFGSAEDGSLEIWVDGEHYVSVDEIPDSRIRDAITESVQAFNE